MGVSTCGRAKYLLLVAVLLVAALSSTGAPSLHAQENPPAIRWDGLIELISGAYAYPPPSSEPPIPADGPSRMSRHAVSGDGRYIIFTAEAPSLGSYSPVLYIRDRRTSDTQWLLGGEALDAVISADGNHVAFRVCDPWMRPDQQAVCDVWAVDIRTRALAVLSATPDGLHGDADSSEPVLSADGRFVVFRTTATNLVSTGTGGAPQLVIRDRDADGNGVFDEFGTATMETISVGGASGTIPGNGPSETAEVSDDGRYVAFRSLASNLVPGDTNGVWDVFRRDRAAQRTIRISTRPSGADSPYPVDSPAIAMSADGQTIAFTSADSLLAPQAVDDTNDAADVFVYHASTPGLRRVDIGAGSPAAGEYVPGNMAAEWPSLTADGRYLVLQSASTNVPLPPPTGTTQVYAVDLVTGVPTRISVRPDGTQPDASAERPMISADGTLVSFISQALNLSGNVTTPLDRIYAAVHFAIAPEEVFVPGSVGGVGTFTITTQQHTQWWVNWTDWQHWVWFDSAPEMVGSGELRFKANEVNYEPSPRTAVIRIFDQSVRFTQLAGLSLTSITPSSGPEAGGTRVTFHGTGFEPGMIAYFDGVPAIDTEVIDATTLTATSPAHTPVTVWVGVWSMGSPNAWLDQAYRYTDGTPPTIWSWVNGIVTADGWYTSDAEVNFWVSDEHSAVTETSGCDQTVVTADTPGVTFTCQATSEGGTATASVTVKRDTTGPVVSVLSPTAGALYELYSSVQPEYTCSDALSGVAQCGDGGGQPLDTTQPGWRTHWGFGLDKAGNPGFSMVDYAVSYGYCIAPSPEMRLWFEFEGDTRDSVHGHPYATPVPADRPLTYTAGVVGNAVALPGDQFVSWSHPELPDMTFNDEMTFAAWVRADGHAGEAGTIVSREDQFRIARFPDGTLRWAFANSDTGFEWVNTGATIAPGAWTHLVVTYDHGLVKTYLNERLVHTHTGAGPIEPLALLFDGARRVSLGNRHDPAHASLLIGALDEVQLLDRVWQPADVSSSFFAGAQGMCRLARTELIAEPATASVGGTSYVARAQLRETATGLPVPNQAIRLHSTVTYGDEIVGSVTLTTDGDGWITWDAPMAAGAPSGVYAVGFVAYFDGSPTHGGSRGTGAVTVGPGTPVITWPEPAPIVYGTLLGAVQLNASANTNGVFAYTPEAGTALGAGEHELTARFQPSGDGWYAAEARVRLRVLKADPEVDWSSPASIVYGTPLGTLQLGASASTAGTWSYSPAAGTVLAAGDEQILTATFTPSDSANYNLVTLTRHITVTRAAPSLELITGTFTYDGQPHGATASAKAADGSALGPVTITYNGEPGEPVGAGSYAVVASFPGDANYQAATANGELTIARATPVLTWSPPAAIGYGTALGGLQLNALSTVPGTFSYSPAAGTMPVAGAAQRLTATFTPADDINYNSGSITVSIDVSKAQATLTVTGGAYTYDGSPHPASATVTGIAGEDLGAVALTYNGGETAPVNAGTYTVAASYPGGTNYEPASATALLTIAKAAAGLTWARPAAILYGTPLGDAQLNAGSTVAGAFVYSPAAGTVLQAGTQQSLSVTFVPSDPANYEGGTGSTTIDIARAPLAIAASDASKRFGAPLPVFSASARGLIAGDSIASLGGELVFSTAATQQSPVGTYPIVVSGVTSPNYAITFVNGTLTVMRGTVSVALTTGPSPSGYEQPMTFTAVVGATLPAPAAPQGVVRFFDGSTLIGSAPLADGIATIATAGLGPGSRPIAAQYDGDGSFEAGAGSSTHVVLDAPATPSISLASTRNPSNYGQTVTLTAQVTRWGVAVSGSVDFYADAEYLSSAPLDSGRATYTTSILPLGSHGVTARYRGAADVPPVRSAIMVQAVGAPGWKDRASGIQLMSSSDTIVLGQPATFVADVTGWSGWMPTGRVAFMVNGDLVGEVALSSTGATTGRATFSVSGLNHGRHTVTATYLGDSNYRGSTAAVIQAVN